MSSNIKNKMDDFGGHIQFVDHEGVASPTVKE